MATVTIEPTFEARNEYDDDRWARASSDLIAAVMEMVEAGATSDEIEADIENGLGEAGF